MFHDFIVHGRDVMVTVHRRIIWLIHVACIGFAILIIRLFWVSIVYRFESRTMCVEAMIRREIVDAQGKVLAQSLPSFSLAVKPALIGDLEEAVQDLHRVLPFLSKSFLRKKLSSKKRFAWVCRQLSPRMRLQVLALGIEGLELFKTQKRVYPYEHLFSHILGAVDVEQQGVAGIEKGCNQELLDSSLVRSPVQLSVDVRLQYVLRKEILACMKAFQAEGGNAVLADLRTGEILAMVSLPDFNSNVKDQAFVRGSFNRNTSGVYEFGSILKIHNLALFLDAQKGTLDTVFDATHPLAVGRFLVKDFKGKCRPLTVREGFLYSSNIVNGKMALESGIEAQKEFFAKMSFFEPIRLEVPEFATPLIPKRWSQARLITSGYGYGFSVTPLHIVQSLQILLNYGKKVPLTLRKRPGGAVPSDASVLKNPHISQILAQIMEMAVKDGQAHKVKTLYCRVGAKTGTANALVKGRYKENCNLTSCVAVFPMPMPRYVLLVSIDRPKGNASTHYYNTAGWIAAPATQRIIEQIVGFLGVMQSEGSIKAP